MRIAYLCADLGIGVRETKGSAIHIRQFTKALAAQGHQVTILSASAGGHDALDERVALYEVAPRMLRAPRFPLLLYELSKILYNWQFLRESGRLLAAGGADLLYERYSLYGLAGVWLARRLKAPLIVEFNAPLVEEASRYFHLQMPWLARRFERALINRADALVAVSAAMRGYLVRQGVAAGKVTVVPNGTDLELFGRAPDGQTVRERHGLQGKVVVGFAGSLRPWHGAELLLDIARETLVAYPEARFLVVGEGPMRGELEARAREAGLDRYVVFSGPVAYRDIPEYLAAMDIAVAPYLPVEDFYMSPLKLFDYMATSRAVVASRAGQIGEVITHGVNGLLVEPGNREELCRAIVMLAGDRALRARLGEAARRSVEARYTWNHAAEAVLEIYRGLARQRPYIERSVGCKHNDASSA